MLGVRRGGQGGGGGGQGGGAASWHSTRSLRRCRMNVIIQRMERRSKPRSPKPSPTFTAARGDRAVWLTVLEAREFLRLGDRAEHDRLLDLAANFQLELTTHTEASK